MNDGIREFAELLRTDEGLQTKIKAAMECYTGEPTGEAVFNNVFVPIAAEYGITATYEEFTEYLGSFNDQEMNADELSQVAGGRNKGAGAGACFGIGVGAYVNDSCSKNGARATACIVVGYGVGAQACMGDGTD